MSRQNDQSLVGFVPWVQISEGTQIAASQSCWKMTAASTFISIQRTAISNSVHFRQSLKRSNSCRSSCLSKILFYKSDTGMSRTSNCKSMWLWLCMIPPIRMEIRVRPELRWSLSRWRCILRPSTKTIFRILDEAGDSFNVEDYNDCYVNWKHMNALRMSRCLSSSCCHAEDVEFKRTRDRTTTGRKD